MGIRFNFRFAHHCVQPTVVYITRIDILRFVVYVYVFLCVDFRCTLIRQNYVIMEGQPGMVFADVSHCRSYLNFALVNTVFSAFVP